jgi:glycosyltransferase involved in cell wall biosynthesis
MLKRRLGARAFLGERAVAVRGLKGVRSRSLQHVVARARGAPARQLADRLRALLAALDHPGAADLRSLARSTEDALAEADASKVWLALAVLTGRLPLDDDVVATARRLELDGPGVALAPAAASVTSLLSIDRYRPARVEVVRQGVVVDLHHTSKTDLATGIQRVARQVAARWDRDHEVVLVGWSGDDTALRRLDNAARRRALGEHVGDRRSGTSRRSREQATTVVVPWDCTYVLSELAPEEARTARLLALTRRSGNRTCAIGFDCVPLTTAETADEPMGGAFARLLAAVRHMDTVATISEAAAVEYRGWREMLASVGLGGPAVEAVPLPTEAGEPSAAADAAVRDRLTVGGLPLVLCVGSHEPRKNHLAVLHAADLLWRRGLRFCLGFVGGNAWKSERFEERLAALQGQGRFVESVSSLDDDLLWAAYRLAHVVVFPSINEGFGLPIAEALACGTPVVTSRHGAMAEVAVEGGALLVDPRDDHDLANALGRVLEDRDLHAELVAEARRRPHRTWDKYAAELWQLFVGSVQHCPPLGVDADLHGAAGGLSPSSASASPRTP